MPCSMERWRGKVALVTGASAGIGAAIAAEFVQHGINVVAIARRLDRLEELKNKSEGPGEIFPFKADITKEEDIEAAFQFIRSKLGNIHILVNNAGLYHTGKISNQDPKLIREVLDVNVMGGILCTQQALKLMKENEIDDGHIININSIDGHQVLKFSEEPSISIFSASKFAVTAITETLRQELVFFKSKVRVTSISPGYVATGEEDSKELLEESKTWPALNPQDIADATVYVLSTPPHVQIHELTIKPVGETF